MTANHSFKIARQTKRAASRSSLSSLSVAGAIVAVCCLAAPAHAATSAVTYVSGKGTNSGSCATAATACRTFQYAIDKTTAAGEVKALDPSSFGAMLITKSISITGVEGASVNAGEGDQVTINAKASDVVSIANLILDGGRVEAHGIVLNSAGSLSVEHCVVRNFGYGIVISPSVASRVLIKDVVASSNSFTGIHFGPTSDGGGVTLAALDRVVTSGNGRHGVGVLPNAGRQVFVEAVDSAASNNSSAGFSVAKGGSLRLTRSSSSQNSSGVVVLSGGVAQSAGDNFIFGNSTGDVSPADGLTKVGTK
jgi:hypothetical protein